MIRNQRMALFSFQRPFSTYTNCLAVYLKEKGKRLPHTLKKEYRHNFLTSSRPWHALRCLLWICNYSPQDSVQKKIFFFFAFCPFIPDSNESFVCFTSSQQVHLIQNQSASHYILEIEALSIQPHNIRKDLI